MPRAALRPTIDGRNNASFGGLHGEPLSPTGIGVAGTVAAIATGAVFAGLAATGVGLLVAGPIAGLVAGIGVGGMAGSFAATLASAGLDPGEAIPRNGGRICSTSGTRFAQYRLAASCQARSLLESCA